FADHEQAVGEEKRILSKQIDYVTKPIPVSFLHRHLKEAFTNNEAYDYFGHTHTLRLKNGAAKAKLIIEDSAIHLYSKGDRFSDVETMFFEVLRKCEPTFFALSYEEKRYGWLRPFKQNIFGQKSYV